MLGIFSTVLLWIWLIVIISFIVLVFRALLKYIHSDSRPRMKKTPPAKDNEEKKPLCEILKAQRTARRMTQEFVAEKIGVSRQAVSKWEQGISEPNASNLLALSRLFDLSLDDLLKDVR